jgi:hypothetical protein
MIIGVLGGVVYWRASRRRHRAPLVLPLPVDCWDLPEA